MAYCPREWTVTEVVERVGVSLKKFAMTHRCRRLHSPPAVIAAPET
jgi:hypothetical protein